MSSGNTSMWAWQYCHWILQYSHVPSGNTGMWAWPYWDIGWHYCHVSSGNTSTWAWKYWHAGPAKLSCTDWKHQHVGLAILSCGSGITIMCVWQYCHMGSGNHGRGFEPGSHQQFRRLVQVGSAPLEAAALHGTASLSEGEAPARNSQWYFTDGHRACIPPNQLVKLPATYNDVFT